MNDAGCWCETVTSMWEMDLVIVWTGKARKIKQYGTKIVIIMVIYQQPFTYPE